MSALPARMEAPHYVLMGTPPGDHHKNMRAVPFTPERARSLLVLSRTLEAQSDRGEAPTISGISQPYIHYRNSGPERLEGVEDLPEGPVRQAVDELASQSGVVVGRDVAEQLAELAGPIDTTQTVPLKVDEDQVCKDPDRPGEYGRDWMHSRPDLYEIMLMSDNPARVQEAFQSYSEEYPERAVLALRQGVGPHFTEEPPRRFVKLLGADDMAALLTSEERTVRQEVMRTMQDQTSEQTRGGHTMSSREQGPGN